MYLSKNTAILSADNIYSYSLSNKPKLFYTNDNGDNIKKNNKYNLYNKYNTQRA